MKIHIAAMPQTRAEAETLRKRLVAEGCGKLIFAVPEYRSKNAVFIEPEAKHE